MARRFATRFARIDSRESFAIETPIIIARQADSPESLESLESRESIRTNHATKAKSLCVKNVCAFFLPDIAKLEQNLTGDAESNNQTQFGPKKGHNDNKDCIPLHTK